jgi:hypothetical protein
MESAKRASEIHKKRTGRSLRVTEEDVINEEMYEEEEDDLPMQYQRLTAHLHTSSMEFRRRLSDYVAAQVAMRTAVHYSQHDQNGEGGQGGQNGQNGHSGQNGPGDQVGQNGHQGYPPQLAPQPFYAHSLSMFPSPMLAQQSQAQLLAPQPFQLSGSDPRGYRHTPYPMPRAPMPAHAPYPPQQASTMPLLQGQQEFLQPVSPPDNVDDATAPSAPVDASTQLAPDQMRSGNGIPAPQGNGAAKSSFQQNSLASFNSPAASSFGSDGYSAFTPIVPYESQLIIHPPTTLTDPLESLLDPNGTPVFNPAFTMQVLTQEQMKHSQFQAQVKQPVLTDFKQEPFMNAEPVEPLTESTAAEPGPGDNTLDSTQQDEEEELNADRPAPHQSPLLDNEQWSAFIHDEQCLGDQWDAEPGVRLP